jgi:RNA polymerase sigma-70 factor (ECF subfamily)
VPEAINDEFLVERARGGDQRAFLLLYECHRSEIFGFVYRLTGSIEVAEDITHDCFLSLIRGFEKVQASTSSSLQTQLYSTARNLAIEYFSRSGYEATDDPVHGREQRLNWHPSEVSSSEVRKAVLSLPLLEREALVLSEYEGLRPNHIATIVATDVETVIARIDRARQRLRNTLAK